MLGTLQWPRPRPCPHRACILAIDYKQINAYVLECQEGCQLAVVTVLLLNTPPQNSVAHSLHRHLAHVSAGKPDFSGPHLRWAILGSRRLGSISCCSRVCHSEIRRRPGRGMCFFQQRSKALKGINETHNASSGAGWKPATCPHPIGLTESRGPAQCQWS